jgi:transcription initiation factor IIE alpha subunit
MKRLFYCNDCKFFESYSGFSCPKCGSVNYEIDDERDLEALAENEDIQDLDPDQDAGEYFEYAD